ncbi:MAG: hypothetical protein JWM35_711 [Verrucomicrobia bacterium]|nr:hypothetical protein [Verrucomicrobiota bacterium]
MHATFARGEKITPLRRNLRLGLWDGITAMPLTVLSQPGNFVVAALLTTVFSLSTSTYGLVTSLPFWFNFLQVLLTPVLAKRLHARSMTIASAGLQIFGWVVLLAGLPFIPPGERHRTVAIFVAVFSVVALASAINGVAWNAWMQECIPVKLRGKYFGFRNRLLYLSQVGFMLAVSGLLAGLDGSLLAYELLFGGAIVLRIISVVAQYRMRNSTSGNIPPPEPAWQEQVRTVWKDQTLVRFIVFASVMGFAVNVVGPFYPIFMYEELHLSAAHTNMLLLLGVLAAAIAFPTWGHLLDRFGNVPVMIVSVILWQVSNLFMCVSDPGNTWILYLIMPAGGFFSAGYGIGLFGLLLKLTPSNARTMGMALFVSLSSLAAALGPITGGFLLNFAKSRGVAIIDVYHIAFVVSPFVVMLSCLFLRRVHEANSAAVAEVMGAMRSVRTMASLFGLSFLVNQVFFRAAKKTAL